MRVPRWVWAIAGVVLVAGLLSPFASSLPDGLESILEREHIPVAEREQPSPLPDYQTPGIRGERLSVFIAAAFGIVFVVLVTFAIGRLLSRATSRRQPPPESAERHESV